MRACLNFHDCAKAGKFCSEQTIFCSRMRAIRRGQSGEKYNEVQSKICRLQPIDGILNMLIEKPGHPFVTQLLRQTKIIK